MSTLYGSSTNPLSGFGDDLPVEDEVDPWGPPPSSTSTSNPNQIDSNSDLTSNPFGSNSDSSNYHQESSSHNSFDRSSNSNPYQEQSQPQTSNRFNDSYNSNNNNYNQQQSYYPNIQQSNPNQSAAYNNAAAYNDPVAAVNPSPSPYSNQPQPQIQQPPPQQQQQAYQPYSHQGQPGRPSPFASSGPSSSPSLRGNGALPPHQGGSSFRPQQQQPPPIPVYSPFARVESLNTHRDNNAEDMYGVPENFLEVEVRNPTTHGQFLSFSSRTSRRSCYEVIDKSAPNTKVDI